MTTGVMLGLSIHGKGYGSIQLGRPGSTIGDTLNYIDEAAAYQYFVAENGDIYVSDYYGGLEP